MGISENSQGSYLIGPKGRFKKNFRIPRNKTLVPGSHRENVRTSKFWQKSKEKKEKNSNIVPPPPRSYQVFIQAKKIQNFTCVLLKVVFSFFHLQLF
jgi:hypothetical protein